MVEKKPLHFAKNFEELQRLTTTVNVYLMNVDSACNLLNKLYEKHEDAYLLGDDELTFLFGQRFLDSLRKIKTIFKTNIKYINAVINDDNARIALYRSEALKDVLKRRYKALSLSNNLEHKCKTKYVRIPMAIIPNEFSDVISCIKLYRLLVNDQCHVLVIDTRTQSHYNQCHIANPAVLNIPLTELNDNSSIVNVNMYLKKKGDVNELNAWDERSSASIVVLLDWDTKDLIGINLVKNVINKWDDMKIMNSSVMLEGGLKSFLSRYPAMVTNSYYKGPIFEMQITKVYSKDVIHQVNTTDVRKIKKEKKRKRKKSIKASKEKNIAKINNKICFEDKNDTLINEEAENCPDVNVIQNIINEEFSFTLKGSCNESNSAKSLRTSVSYLNCAIDEHLKSDVYKVSSINDDISIIPNMSVNSTRNGIINKSVTLSSLNLLPICRLSNNFRTDLDRNYFMVRGGAKSIAPPPEINTFKKTLRKLECPSSECCCVDCNLSAKCNDKVPNEYVNSTKNIIKRHINTLKTYCHRNMTNMRKGHSLLDLRKHSVSVTMNLFISQPNLTNETLVCIPNVPDVLENFDVDKDYASTFKKCNIFSLKEFDSIRLKSFNPIYKKVTPGLTGLHNLGNLCYMNSVIQALSNTKFLTNYILSGNYSQDINKKNPLGYQGDLINEFASLITALWKGVYKQISPLDFKVMVDKKNDMFHSNEQHDSQEFLLFILDGLHEDLNVGVKNTKLEVIDDCEPMSDVQKAQLSWEAHVTVNNSVIVKMFQGQFRSKVTCDHCLNSSVTFDAFMYLSLPLVCHHNRCSLNECIKLFLSEEKMTGTCQWFCAKCKVNRNARKKIDIWKLPPYLLIHLKRFSYNDQCRQKLNTFVDFPIEPLSLSKVLSDTSVQPHKHEIYRLYAVSNHNGKMESGHYTSFCKNMNNNKWYCYDDDVVTCVTETEIKTPLAYILFYESCNFNKKSFMT